MNRLQRISQVLVVLLSFGFLSVNTLAQSAKTLEEVIITAQKKEESLLDSAIDVSVFSGEDLQKYSVSDMSGVALVTPGLTFQNTVSGHRFILGESVPVYRKRVWIPGLQST
jgi:iron complex outermembrane receptor protein